MVACQSLEAYREEKFPDSRREGDYCMSIPEPPGANPGVRDRKWAGPRRWNWQKWHGLKSDILTAQLGCTPRRADEGGRRVHGERQAPHVSVQACQFGVGVRQFLIGCSNLLPRVIVGYLNRLAEPGIETP
jgi:hypothetical protein